MHLLKPISIFFSIQQFFPKHIITFNHKEWKMQWTKPHWARGYCTLQCVLSDPLSTTSRSANVSSPTSISH